MCGKTARNTLNQYTKKTKQKTCRMDLIYKGDSQSYIYYLMPYRLSYILSLGFGF